MRIPDRNECVHLPVCLATRHGMLLAAHQTGAGERTRRDPSEEVRGHALVRDPDLESRSEHWLRVAPDPGRVIAGCRIYDNPAPPRGAGLSYQRGDVPFR